MTDDGGLKKILILPTGPLCATALSLSFEVTILTLRDMTTDEPAVTRANHTNRA